MIAPPEAFSTNRFSGTLFLERTLKLRARHCGAVGNYRCRSFVGQDFPPCRSLVSFKNGLKISRAAGAIEWHRH
jgi:hypothetical protein